MKMHRAIETGKSTTDGVDYDLPALCTKGGGTCASALTGVCQCRISSILRQWNYDLSELEADGDFWGTLSEFGSPDDIAAVVSEPVFDDNGKLVSARAFSMNYFLDDRSFVEKGADKDPINEDWEKDVFLETVESDNYPSLFLNFFAVRSRTDEGGSAIQGDLLLVQVSYVVVFLFLGATMGNFKCGSGSRWTVALAALALVAVQLQELGSPLSWVWTILLSTRCCRSFCLVLVSTMHL